MPVRIRHPRATLRLLGLASVAVVAAACSSGGSATGAPSTGASLAGSPASCPDLAAIGKALTAEPDWRASGVIPFTAVAADGGQASATAAVAYAAANPDQSSLTVNFTGIAAGGLASVQSMTVAQDRWTSAYGSQAWIHTKVADASGEPSTGPLAAMFAAGKLTPVTDAPAVELPGSSPCVLAFEMAPPTPRSDSGVLPLSSVQYVVMRVDPATALPESFGFIADPASLLAGEPPQAVLAMDYASSIQITPPDARFVVEPGTPGVPIPTRPPGIPALPLP
jgi:hypothetical protein